jgi:NadR type nicotinamide-nucleotide adenylyltransferase
MHKIVICGPESTGKTTLTKQLAKHFNAQWVPEFARDYISNLNRDYTYNDVELIAKEQIKQWELYDSKKDELVFFDTGLIVTNTWFKEVYEKHPEWLDEKLSDYKPALYLLCYYDLEWEFDPIRENGSNEKRAYLFNKYLEEIKKIGCKYQIIKGFNQERFKLAIQTIERVILKC